MSAANADDRPRVVVFCNDESRNFHKNHGGKTWLAEFRQRDTEAPEGHFMRWESIGHITRRTYAPTDTTATSFAFSASANALSMTGHPSTWATERKATYEEVITKGVDEKGRIVPSQMLKEWRQITLLGESRSEPGTRLVKQASWSADRVFIVPCACKREIAAISTGKMVRLLDRLHAAGVTEIELRTLSKALALIAEE